VLARTVRQGLAREAEEQLLLAREVPPDDVEQHPDLLAHLPGVLIARDEADELVHLLVLVAQAPQGTERAGLALVGSEQRLLLHSVVAEERDRERLGRGAELGHAPATIERIVELLDQKVKYSVLS
jgi:hypothetical protein